MESTGAEVQSLLLLTPEKTGRTDAYAFASFTRLSDAKRAWLQAGTLFSGRRLRIHLSPRSKEEKRAHPGDDDDDDSDDDGSGGGIALNVERNEAPVPDETVTQVEETKANGQGNQQG